MCSTQLEVKGQYCPLIAVACFHAGRTFTSTDAFSIHHVSDRCNSMSLLLQHPVISAAASHAAADSLLWTSYGAHSLQPAIAAVLSQPSVTGDALCISIYVVCLLQCTICADDAYSLLDAMHIASGTSGLAPVQRQLLEPSEWLDHGPCVPNISEDQPAAPAMSLVKRTYQPSVIVRKRRHGFLSRLRSKGGQRVLERRRLKGRWKKSA